MLSKAKFVKKMKYSGIAALVLGAGLALAPNCASLASNAGSTAQAAEAVEYSRPKNMCTPHYLEGVKRPVDPVENMVEKYRVYKTMKMKYPSSTTTVINGSIEEKQKIHGVDATLIFPNYVRQKDGTVRHYHAASVIPDIYSAKEFQCVVEDTVDYISRSGKLQIADYEGMLPLILEAQEKELKKKGALKKDQKLKDFLDKNVSDYVPGFEGIKIKDILHTPDMTIRDSIPTRYYFGDIGALGVSYTDSGTVGIDPKARVLDYITGKPVTLMHEMTHRNQKLQHSPLMYKVDAELWASFPELGHEDLLHFLYHSYLKDARKVAKICFGLDSELAKADITYLNTMMGTEFEKENNNQKLRKYIKDVKDISKAIKEVAFKKYLPEFYAHPDHYMTLNDVLKDKNATFKIIMYMNYHPSLLGGPEKTRDFVLENEEFSEKLARKVIWDLKGKRNNLKDDSYFKEIKDTLEERLKGMHPAKKRSLFQAVRKFGITPTNITNEEVINFGLRLYQLGIIDFDEGDMLFKW